MLHFFDQVFLFDFVLESVSKELNHFGVIAGLFRQIGGHSSRFVLFCSFWRLFTIKMIKSVKVFPFSFWKRITIFFYFIKFKWLPSDLTPWTLNFSLIKLNFSSLWMHWWKEIFHCCCFLLNSICMHFYSCV